MAFVTASQWVNRLADAHEAGRLEAELARLARFPLLIIDEVGYILFESEAANLFFQLVSNRYQRASLIDRLVHHAEVIELKGDSYRLKDRDMGRAPASSESAR